MLIEQMFPNSKLYRASSQSIIGERASGSPSPKSSPGATPSRNLWLDHLNLMEDGFSDPPGIRVRAIEGLEAVTYLDPNPLVRVSSVKSIIWKLFTISLVSFLCFCSCN